MEYNAIARSLWAKDAHYAPCAQPISSENITCADPSLGDHSLQQYAGHACVSPDAMVTTPPGRFVYAIFIVLLEF